MSSNEHARHSLNDMQLDNSTRISFSAMEFLQTFGCCEHPSMEVTYTLTVCALCVCANGGQKNPLKKRRRRSANFCSIWWLCVRCDRAWHTLPFPIKWTYHFMAFNLNSIFCVCVAVSCIALLRTRRNHLEFFFWSLLRWQTIKIEYSFWLKRKVHKPARAVRR